MPSDDEERHLNMLHGITGMPPQAFEGECFFGFDLKMKLQNVFLMRLQCSFSGMGSDLFVKI